MDDKQFALHDAPVDRVAARVVFRRGEQWIPGCKPGTLLEFDSMPPPLVRERRPWEMPPEDLSGRKWGRLTAIAWAGKGDHGQRWICRCVCGRYTTRQARTIKAAKDADDKCLHCRHLAFLKRDEQYRRDGYNLDSRAEILKEPT